MKQAIFFFCAVFALTLCAGMDARANSLLISPNPNQGQKFPTQGDCHSNGIDPSNPNIDVTRSTWACSGASQQMMFIFYREGPQECVYIDNFNNDNGRKNAFFVPLQTSDEWLAFAANLPGGVRLRRGCKGVIMTDPCGNRFALPDVQASDSPNDVFTVTTSNGAYKADYTCPLTSTAGASLTDTGGCGAWVKGKEDGVCTKSGGGTSVSVPDTGSGVTPITPPINDPGATTSIPGGETPGPVINTVP
jgi:hypothetical protein